MYLSIISVLVLTNVFQVIIAIYIIHAELDLKLKLIIKNYSNNYR